MIIGKFPILPMALVGTTATFGDSLGYRLPVFNALAARTPSKILISEGESAKLG
jgi:hypothetical protein